MSYSFCLQQFPLDELAWLILMYLSVLRSNATFLKNILIPIILFTSFLIFSFLVEYVLYDSKDYQPCSFLFMATPITNAKQIVSIVIT